MPSSVAIGTFKFLVSRVFDGVLQFFIDKAIRSLAKMSLPGFWRLHFVELKSAVSRMPFIYHQDLPSDVLTEFVEIDMATLDPNLMRRPKQRVEKKYAERIRDHKHVFLFGRAGVGKTTFLRHAILDIVQSKGRESGLAKDTVPFYVPLKAIDSTEELPILNYLLRHNSVLSGSNGMRRLTNLASNYRLLLCLDGYDEIPFPSSTQNNSVFRELALLTGGVSPITSMSLSEDQTRFYEKAAYCRVWLTSRLEFFSDNRFEIGRHTLAVEIAGVLPENRARLVKHIFSRYEHVLQLKGVAIDHELFINRVDRSGRDELVKLSFNPLFLTIMAFIYVKGVLERGRYDVGLGHDIVDLVEKCVELLLIDLDKERARGLPEAHRDGLLCRRNEWIKEKREFLSFFALKSLLHSMSTFSATDIEQQARSFFTGRPDLTESERILRSLRSTPTLPGFVDQLIYCDLFVQVGQGESGPFYDFPHRKFREVLAAKYLATLPDRRAFLVLFIDDPQLQEPLYALFEDGNYQDEIVTILCQKITEKPTSHHGTALDICLDRIPDQYAHSERLWSFFASALQEHRGFKMPLRVLSHIKPEDHQLVKLVAILKKGVEEADSLVTALCCELMQHRYGSDVLFEALNPYLPPRVSSNVFATVFYEFLRAGGTVSEELVTSIAADRRASLDLAAALSASISGEITQPKLETFQRLLLRTQRPNFIALMYVMEQTNPNIIPNLADKGVISEVYEVAALLCHRWKEVEQRKPFAIITRGAINRVIRTYPREEQNNLRDTLWPARGSICFDRESFLRTGHSRSDEADFSGRIDNRTSDRFIPPLVRAMLLEDCLLAAEGTYERVRNELDELSYDIPQFPVFFE